MKRFVALLAAILTLVLSAVGVAGAQDGPSELTIHRVDSRTAPVEMMMIADAYNVGADAVSITEDGVARTIERVTTAAATGQAHELVFVIDSDQRMVRADALAEVTSTLQQELRQLPNGLEVGVVQAGSSAITMQKLTSDGAAASSGVGRIEVSSGAVLVNAVDRAVSLFTEEDPEIIRTLVVISAGEDTGSAISLGGAQAALIARGAQLVHVQIDGGSPNISAMVSRVGGMNIATDRADLSATTERAFAVASDRLVVQYDGSTSLAERSDVKLTVAGVTRDVSFGAGEFVNRTLALTPVIVPEPSRFSFLQTSMGLYGIIGLAFIGIALAVFSLGQLFAGGQTSLDGLLSKYAAGGDEADLTAEDSAIVQTAFVQRAVEMSESFAEDRGFLLKVEELLERAKIPLRPGEAMSFYLAMIAFGGALGFFLLGGILGAMIAMFLVAVMALGYVRFRASRRIRAFEKQLPDTLQLLAGTLRAGYSLPQGLEAVSKESVDPMGYELRRVMTEARLGRELEEALGSAAERLNSPDFAWAVMAIGIQREVGGNLNELLMTVSDTMTARERLKGEVATLTAEGKMSAILLGGLPPGLGFVMWLMNPEYINTLFTNFLGNIFLGLGVVASLIGFAWMKKVITINV